MEDRALKDEDAGHERDEHKEDALAERREDGEQIGENRQRHVQAVVAQQTKTGQQGEQDRHVLAGQVVCPGEVEQLQNENDHDDGERNVLPHKRGMGRENRAQQIKGRREHDAEP